MMIIPLSSAIQRSKYIHKVGSEVSGNYNGCNIDFDASTENFGNVLAGNKFNSIGSSIIYGFISALSRCFPLGKVSLHDS